MNEVVSETALGDTIREIRAAASAVRESSVKITTAVEHASNTAISAAYLIGVRDGCIVTAIALLLLYLILTRFSR
jgi:hypothetical protein